MLYAAGMVSDPIEYAIDTLKRVNNMIGQDKQVTFALMALEEMQAAGVAHDVLSVALEWMHLFQRYAPVIGVGAEKSLRLRNLERLSMVLESKEFLSAIEMLEAATGEVK